MKISGLADAVSGRGARGAGFVLLEVLVSLVILSVGVTTSLQSLRQSLEAARNAERLNAAIQLGQALIEEMQITPPPEGEHEGSFAPDYPEYSFQLEVELEEPKYRNDDRGQREEELRPLCLLHLEMYYQHPNPNRGRQRMIELDSAVIPTQKFSHEALQEYQLFEIY